MEADAQREGARIPDLVQLVQTAVDEYARQSGDKQVLVVPEENTVRVVAHGEKHGTRSESLAQFLIARGLNADSTQKEYETNRTSFWVKKSG